MSYGIRSLIFTQADLPNFLEQEVGIKLSYAGADSYRCFCPLPHHSESKPSFQIDFIDGGWKWHCFGCGEGGTIIEFVQKFYALTSAGAIKTVCDKLEIKNDLSSMERAMRMSHSDSKTKKSVLVTHLTFCDRCRIMIRENMKDNELRQRIGQMYREANKALAEVDEEKINFLLSETNKFFAW